MNDREYEIFLEIENHLLKDKKPSMFVTKLLEEEQLDKYPFSIISDLRTVPQNPKYHSEGNVFKHTMMVIDEGAENRNKSHDKRAFMWALLLHDIGKKPTTKMRKGRLTSYNHDKVGKVMAEEFLRYFNLDEEFINKVAGLVRWHMQSLFFTKQSRVQNIKEMLNNVEINEIVLVSLSDRLGRGCVDKDRRKEIIEEIERFKEKLIKKDF